MSVIHDAVSKTVGEDGRESTASLRRYSKCSDKRSSAGSGERLRGSGPRGMRDVRPPARYWPQLWATLVRSLLLKKRDTRKTLAEVLVPLYSLGVLIFLKMLVPNPNFPEVSTPGQVLSMHHGVFTDNYSVAVVAEWMNPNGTIMFLEEMNAQLVQSNQRAINWIRYNNTTELNDGYQNDTKHFPITVIFHTDPSAFGEPLRYTIRTNPSHDGTPSTRTLTTSPAKCRERQQSADWSSDWSRGGQLIPLSEMHREDTCPVLQYYYSGFLALQSLIDYTKIKLDTGNSFPPPKVDLRMFPKKQHTGDWLVIFRVIMPMYMVMTLSQFITYLLMFVVGEKEKKIREGMRIMGLKDSAYWGSWFLIYAVFVTILSIFSTVLLFTLKVFQHSSYILIFLLMLLFGFTIITLAFMITPFFDKARTAGILGSFAVNLMSALYFIQVFVSNADSLAFWFLSLISSSCYALAMDKALVLDMKGVGVTWDNLWSGPGVPFGGSLIMMALDTVLYALVAYWLDAVIPSEYGIKQKPWFCLLPSFWCGRGRGRVAAVHLHTNGEAAHTNKDVEPVPRELLNKEAIRIVGLQKSFRHCRRAEVKAIDGIDLSIYEGQITAVLGHNGAGKSTLFNILTGLTAPTAGTAYVYGLDVRDPCDMHEIRQMIGVCPQEDVLFDLLTVKEHLKFFATIKGIPSEQIPDQVQTAMAEVHLTEQAAVFAKHLSGGQKRKLSIAIALIGDPKIIILDEPTAGVDPVSRRQTWRILQRARAGRVLLLTTHFMDEADILGDRKAVISKGKVRCAGTSLFLKNKFGIGYHLTLVLDGVCRENQITRLVRGHVPRAEKARRHGRELSYILPHYTVHLFPPLFQAIEHEIREKTNRLGITSYGVSMTTLEEVFLSLEGENTDETEPVEGLSSVKLVRARALSRSLSLQSKTLSYQELNDKELQKPTPLPNPPASHALHSTTHGIEHVKVAPEVPLSDVLGEMVKTSPNCWRTFCAMVYIRTMRMIRDPYKLYMMIFVPIISCALGLYIKSRQIVFFKMQPLKLDPNAYLNRTPIALHNDGVSFKELEDMKESLETLGAYPIVDFDGNFSSLLGMENFGAFSVGPSRTQYGKILAYYNSTYTHSLPIIINLLDNSIYRTLMSGSGALENYKPIEVLTHPFQQTEQQEEFNLGNVVCAIFMGMIFALVPVTLAVDIVYDREIKAKNQLRVNGLSMGMYFLTYFTVLIIIMVITSAGVLVLVILNDIPSLTNGPAIIMLSVLLLLYCPSAILFNTCLSYIFDKMDSAQSIMPNITTWIGVIPFILVAVLDTFKWGNDIAFYLHTVFSFLDVMYIPYAIIYYVDRVYVTCNLRDHCPAPALSNYFTREVWVLLAAMLLHVPACGAALLAADAAKGSAPVCKGGTRGNTRRSSAAAAAEAEAWGEAGEDEDVRRERRRVHAALHAAAPTAHPANPAQPALLVHNLRKEYRVRGTGEGGCCGNGDEGVKKTGLARLSLAVEGGEVFGLLGHNGAGKTTTMKIITAEERPTCGTVVLGGQDVESSPEVAFQMLGYCPQHDALWKNVTIREHIECYAAIRGVSKADTPRIVDAYLNGLQIMEHAGKHADECSGGTRRKLSFALAMVGSPRVVLLDEPSTGMDPRSKRFLWDTILASFQGKKGAILTTHSMEEADALCSRVGIMVKGGLRCIGSTQHLKNLYGAGYTLEMKIGQNNNKSTMLDNEMSMSPSPLRSSENSPSLGEADEGGGECGADRGGGDTEADAEAEADAVDVSIHTPLVAACTPDRTTHLHRSEGGGGGGGEGGCGGVGAGAEAAVALVARLFPAAVLEESFAERLVFSVPQSAVSSLATCFHQIEEAKERLNIVEYSFSQTTLEQVFLKFAQSESADQE